jgi:hypothetical protein
MDLTPKNAEKYNCESCDFKCSKYSDWIRHIGRLKHSKVTFSDTSSDAILHPDKQFICQKCNKVYKSRNGLWVHKKQCYNTNINDGDSNSNSNNSNNIINNNETAIQLKKPTLEYSMVFDFVKQMTENNEILIKHQIEKDAENNKQSQEIQKQSQEFQLQMFNQMMEFMKQQCAITNNNINNGQINNNHNHFNLQLYLNETCKNAMTINQFLDYLQPTLQELEDTAHLGYVESISRIIMRGFKNLEEEELPFHCTDLKREHIYVKNPDKEWIKETDEKPLLLRFIKEVAKRNFNNIFAWQKQNPSWSSYNSKQNDLYNSIVENAMSGATEKEQNDNYEKIMKNIMKNIVIDKSKKNK